MLTEKYAENLISRINNIAQNQNDKILSAASMVKKVIEDDGIVYIFGCGHSHMLAEEGFYRAGGLACVSPVFYEPLMLHESASLSSKLEKQDSLYEKVLSNYDFTEKDLVICISSSGVNSVPVEVAWRLHELGIKTIGITSDEYDNQIPHNPQNAHMKDFCDIYINNMAPHGDACMSIGRYNTSPVSTVTGAFILNSILLEATEMAVKDGIDVPVYTSGNIPGGADKNTELIKKYKKRIKHL